MDAETQIARRRDYYRRKPIDGQVLKRIIEASLTWLKTNQEIVNALNVFPVPDGDTGTNMVLTMQAAYEEIKNSPETNFGKMIHSVAHGALMGARGNSGVILSQIWRGFSRSVDDHNELTAETFVSGLAEARETAYKGVVRPVEGTILTVIKDAAEAGQHAISETQDPILLLEKVLFAAGESVDRTPELLDVLREAGVVDAGGKGLFFILEGILRFIDGLPLDTSLTTVKPLSELILDNTLHTIEPGQDWEVIVDFRTTGDFDLDSFYNELETMGTSIQFGEGDGIYRLHIHVPNDKYYSPEDYIKSLGVVTKVAKENLIDQIGHELPGSTEEDYGIMPVEPGNIGVIAVVPGSGIAKIFASMCAAAIVEGGQTMNPSTEEIIKEIDKLPTDNIVILPNNKNIIMAAKNAAEYSGKNVAVIPSITIPQGINSMLRFVPDGDFDTVVTEMESVLEEVETGEITTSTRTVEIDGVKAKKGEFIALLNGKMVASSEKLDHVCLELLSYVHAEEYEIMTMFYGIDVTDDQANEIKEIIEDTYTELEIEVHPGCQPHYQFIISIE